MHNNRGIFLTEVIIFLFLFSFFSMIVMTFIARSITSTMRVNKKSDYIATTTTALDWIMRDVHRIDVITDTTTFNKQVPLLIQHKEEKISWKLQGTTLVRIMQRYDEKLQRWKKPYTSLVSSDVLMFVVTPLYKQYGQHALLNGLTCAIEGVIEGEKYRMLQTIACRNVVT
jgi:hypothetical protein